MEIVGNSNLPYLFAAYAIVWSGLFGYLFFLSRKQRELERELDALRGERRENKE